MALPRPDEGADRERMDSLTRALPSKAEKIRKLARAGYDRTSIARFLGISYQHVRNVLVREAEKGAGEASAADATADEGTANEGTDEATGGRAPIDEGGRLILPPEVIKRLELRRGGVVGWRLEGDEAILMGARAGLRRLREMIRERPLQHGESAVDELIRHRREEARKEEDELKRYDNMGD